jgi:hypothetical protein
MTTHAPRAVFAGLLISASIQVARAAEEAATAVTTAGQLSSDVKTKLDTCQTTLDEARDTSKLFPSERLAKAKLAQTCFSEASMKSSMVTMRAAQHVCRQHQTKSAGSKLPVGYSNRRAAGDHEYRQYSGYTNPVPGSQFWPRRGLRLRTRTATRLREPRVRVSSDVTDGPRVFLEAHYYPEMTRFTNKAGTVGWGPFATFETGAGGSSNSNGLTGFGLGIMGGFKVSNTSSSGFNVGVGYIWEGNIQTLGDGIVANQPLPSGETQIRYKDRSVGALTILFSYKFGSSIPSDSSSTPKS